MRPTHRLILAAMTASMTLAPQGHAGTLLDENLLVGLPTGFVIATSGRQGAEDKSEFVPKGETVNDWSRMVTVQIFHNMGGVAPTKFAETLQALWLAGCAGSASKHIKDTVENGYDATLWAFTCPMNVQTHKPETMFTKITGGADALYSVQYAFRKSLSQEMVTPAMTYLGGIRVCDTRRPDRPCPAGM